MKLQSASQRQTAGMQFQPEPCRAGAAAARGKDPPLGLLPHFHASRRAQPPAGGDERLRHPRIQNIPAHRQRRTRKPLPPRGTPAKIPLHLIEPLRIGEQRLQTELRDRRFAEAADELPAHAVPRVAARLKDRHVRAGAPQPKAQSQPGKATADDFD